MHGIARSSLTTRRHLATLTHHRGFPGTREGMGMRSFDTALKASLIHVPHTFPSRLFAGWGLLTARKRGRATREGSHAVHRGNQSQQSVMLFVPDRSVGLDGGHVRFRRVKTSEMRG